MISIKNLYTSFEDKIVHNNISLNIKKGEIFGILGGSGSGKTTLLRQIILLDSIQKGEIKVLNHNLSSINKDNSTAIKKNWGVLFQFGALFSSLNVLENISIMLKENTNLPKDLIADIAHTKLKMVGLDSRVAKLYPEQLSGGMKKRVALARSLALDPELLFLDEPTSGLDPASAKSFDTLIYELREMLDLTVVIITHELNTIKNVLDRFVILSQGEIILDGNYKDALNSNNDKINKFLKLSKDEFGK